LQGYNTRRLQGKGYLILAFFGPGYRVSVQDMQLVCDVCPLRIDSIFVRELQDGDMQHAGAKPIGGGGGELGRPKVAAVLSICVLDCNQPVRITEAEVVRVRKRSRGLLLHLPSIFGGQ
jgi:hypothetical protein